MPGALCAARLSITTLSLRLRVGARQFLTYTRNLVPFIGPSKAHGARIPFRRSAATNVTVFKCPCGTRPIRRSPRRLRPPSRTIFSVGGGCIDEHKVRRIKHALFSHPASPRPRHIRALLLRRAQVFKNNL